ncbi:MAG: phospholipid carrier-dependent glycosyltransferase [Candidatus Pacebacteria bacterium]|nr:phospholipid carrier-dependent glycosyltransferase [Candidatus Paceibacterota bacterium]
MKKINLKILLLIIVLLTFLPRLYRINNPVADWHSFRQADTASVTRQYIKNGVDLLRPQYQDLSNIQSGKDNLEGWRMVEMPFINAFIASIIRFEPSLNMEIVSRLSSIFFSIGTALSLFYLVKKISGREVAFYSSIVFALLPFSVFYGRTILPEPAMLFFSTSSILLFSYYLDSKKILVKTFTYFVSLIFLSLAILLKPFVAFLGPIYLVLALLKYKQRIFLHLELIFFGLSAFVPFYFWREWIKNFPSGIPASDWLFNSNKIRFRPAWFRWLFYERLTKLILGWWGWLFILANLMNIDLKGWKNNFSKQFQSVVKDKKIFTEISVYGAWIFGVLIYLIIIATGNVQHDYYQVFTLPIISIVVGRGVQELIVHIQKQLSNKRYQKMNKNIKKLSPFIGAGLIFCLMLIVSWNNVKGYFNVNHWEYVKAGEMIDQLTPSDAKVIAPAFGDTIFLYQTNRTGWPIGFEIEDKVKLGAEYYVSTSYDDEARMIEEKYTPIMKTDDFIIIKLEGNNPESNNQK